MSQTNLRDFRVITQVAIVMMALATIPSLMFVNDFVATHRPGVGFTEVVGYFSVAWVTLNFIITFPVWLAALGVSSLAHYIVNRKVEK